jgi:hypothetical protein
MPPEYFFPLLGMTFALAWGLLGTIRWYAKEKLKDERRGTEVRGEGDDARFADLEARVHELEERVDFAERVLSQQRERGRLPADG